LRNGLTLLWLGTAGYLAWKLAVNARRAPLQRGAGKVSAGASKSNRTAADVVEWVLPPASSSPSRADAVRQLPDYCTRLMALKSEKGGMLR
jgi:hypothetical protein